jgi:hypothetical protein
MKRLENVHMVLYTTGNRGTFIGSNIFINTDEFNLNYIRRYPKLMNIG